MMYTKIIANLTRTMTPQTLEQRVAHLEAELERISRLLPADRTPQSPIEPEANWIDRLAGSISNESLFLEALEYGRQYRQNS
jgi:hypothetical protein